MGSFTTCKSYSYVMISEAKRYQWWRFSQPKYGGFNRFHWNLCQESEGSAKLPKDIFSSNLMRSTIFKPWRLLKRQSIENLGDIDISFSFAARHQFDPSCRQEPKCMSTILTWDDRFEMPHVSVPSAFTLKGSYSTQASFLYENKNDGTSPRVPCHVIASLGSLVTSCQIPFPPALWKRSSRCSPTLWSTTL